MEARADAGSGGLDGDLGRDLDLLVRRLRTMSGRARRDPARTAAVRELVRTLASLSRADVPAPEPAAHATADVVAVLARDAVDAGAAVDVARLVQEALAATR